MAIVLNCPHCAKSYRITEELLGRRVQCRHCGEMFQAALPGDTAPVPAGAALPAVVPGKALEIERIRDVTVVRVLAPRISADNIQEIGAALAALADDPSSKRIVLNLARVEFLFSTAMGQIVTLEQKLLAQRGWLRLCELQPVVREALDSAGLTLILKVFDTEREALA